jgi:hypothetical protein
MSVEGCGLGRWRSLILFCWESGVDGCWLIEVDCGIGCWLLDTVRWQGGWWVGAGMVLYGGGRSRKFVTGRAHDTIGGYSVRDAYRLLTTMDAPEVGATSHLIWHIQVPLKVSVLAWRLFRNRLPTKDNLWHATLYNMMLNFVWLVVVCSFLVLFSHLCGLRLGLELVYLHLIRTCYKITLFSLYIFFRRIASTALFLAACLVMLHFGYLAWAKL